MARQQLGHVRSAPARRQDRQVGYVSLDQHVRQFEVSGKDIDDALVSVDPEDSRQSGALGVDIEEQGLDVALGREGESEVDRGERLAFAGPCTRYHYQAARSAIRREILLRPGGHQVSLDETEFL